MGPFVLFIPILDKAKESKIAWHSGHLMGFFKISKMLLEEYQLALSAPSKLAFVFIEYDTL